MNLEARMQHEEEGFSCPVEGLAGPQRVREEGPEHLRETARIFIYKQEYLSIHSELWNRNAGRFTSSSASLMAISTGESVALSFL